MYECKDEFKDECMIARMNVYFVRMNVWMQEWIYECVNARMNVWM